MLSSRESIDWNSVHLDWNGSLDLGKNRLGFRLDVERSTMAWKIVVEPCWLVGWDYLEFTTIVGWVDPWWASMVGRFYHKRYIFICWDGPSGRIRQFIYMLRNAQLIHITLYEVSGQMNEVSLTDNSIVFQEDIPRWKCVTCSLLYPNTIHCAHKSVSLLRFHLWSPVQYFNWINEKNYTSTSFTFSLLVISLHARAQGQKVCC